MAARVRLERRAQDNQHETQQPDHSASDCIMSSTRMRFRYGQGQAYQGPRSIALVEGAPSRRSSALVLSARPSTPASPGHQGIVAKRKDLPYESGTRWLKIKNPNPPAAKRAEDGGFYLAPASLGILPLWCEISLLDCFDHLSGSPRESCDEGVATIYNVNHQCFHFFVT